VSTADIAQKPKRVIDELKQKIIDSDTWNRILQASSMKPLTSGKHVHV